MCKKKFSMPAYSVREEMVRHGYDVFRYFYYFIHYLVFIIFIYHPFHRSFLYIFFRQYQGEIPTYYFKLESFVTSRSTGIPAGENYMRDVRGSRRGFKKKNKTLPNLAISLGQNNISCTCTTKCQCPS